MGAALSPISLGSFSDYQLFLHIQHGTPAALVAKCADKKRCRTYSPKLMGNCMLMSNAAIREAFLRAVRMGYADQVKCANETVSHGTFTPLFPCAPSASTSSNFMVENGVLILASSARSAPSSAR